MNEYLSLGDLTKDEVKALLATANTLQREPIRDTLKGKVLGLVFMNPSLRTLASMQVGVAQLGGASVVLQPGTGSWALETAERAVMDGAAQEHAKDAFPVMARYFDLLAVRCFAGNKDLKVDLEDGLIREFRRLTPKPFINLESAADHPCQALADWKALDDVEIPEDGDFVLSWSWHPRPLPYAVPIAAAEMALKRGMRLTVLRPDGFDLPDETMRKLIAIGGSRVQTTSDRREAMRGAHAIYVKSWAAPACYGNPEADAALRAPLREWCADPSWLAEADNRCRFMHCLPMRRNVEATDALVDGDRSLTLTQAENRLHAQKAVMLKLLS